MTKYRLEAKNDLICIQCHGVKKIGMQQADKYFDSFFEYFDSIVKKPYSYEPVKYIKEGYRRFVCDSDSIYYKINNNVVDIMAIVGRQDLKITFRNKTNHNKTSYENKGLGLKR